MFFCSCAFKELFKHVCGAFVSLFGDLGLSVVFFHPSVLVLGESAGWFCFFFLVSLFSNNTLRALSAQVE